MRLLRRPQSPKARRLTLQEAVAQGLASFELYGVAEGMASKVRLRITKLTDEPLEINVPRGTEFVPVDRPSARPAGPAAAPSAPTQRG